MIFSQLARIPRFQSSISSWFKSRNAPRLRATRQRRFRRQLQCEQLEQRRVFATAILNEVVADTAGTDQPFEYIEIKGTPGAVNSNLYFVSIEGDNPFGSADRVISLDSVAFGSNGLIVIKAPNAGHPTPPETTIITNSAFTSGALENGSNTFALISSPTPIVEGSDLDTNNDGILELPPGAIVVDAIGWTDGAATDAAYGTAILSQSAGNPPGAATRFLHDNRPNNASAWYYGDLTGLNSDTTYTATVANRSTNFPVGGQLTPGNINVPGDTNVAPTGVADAYQVDPSGTLIVNAGGGVLSNDSDANGITSILSAVLVSPPANATSFVFGDDGSFTYTNNGVSGPVMFSYQATDLNLFSATVTVTINVATNTNVGPTLSLPAGAINYNENAPAIILAATGTVTDPDSPNFGSGTLTVDFAANGTLDDRLEVRNEGASAGQIGVVGNVIQFGGTSIGTASGGDGTAPLVIALNSNATIAAVEALIRNVTFRNISDSPSTLARSVRFAVNDGDGGPSGGASNIVSRTVNVISSNDVPAIVSDRSTFTYAAGGEATTVDGFVTVTDVDLTDFDTGVFSATISSGLSSGDVLFVRHTGNGPGQVGVSGNSVSFGGTVVGTTSGGTSGLPLSITYNASSSPTAVQAIARSIAFQTSNARLTPAPRTISFSVTDGDGGTSNTTQYTLTQSQIRRYGYQEGVDSGNGVYSGAGDVMLAQAQPDTHLPQGATIASEGLLVDFDTGSANSAVLLKFDNLVGSGPGQIPANAKIVAARLVLDTNNPGDGGSLYRMVTNWDANAATWNSVPTTLSPTNFPIRNNGVTARTIFDSQVGGPGGGGDPTAGFVTIGVKADIQAWVNGETNFGWLLQGWEGFTDGWGFTASETSIAKERPRLEVDWVPASMVATSFQQGVNGYTGTVDTSLTQATPDVDNSTATGMMFSDFSDSATTPNTSQVLLRFDQIYGGAASQIPAGAYVHGAFLTLGSTLNNGAGDGGQFYAMRQAWPAIPTWNTLTDGVQPDGIEAALVPTTAAGNSGLAPNVQGGWNTFDVTTDIQAWTNAPANNNGWAILPWENGTDGWGINPSESTETKVRPELQVVFTPVGISVTPLSGLNTTEAGGTASFTVKLNTPPTANVTIGLTSSDTTEGTLGVSQLLFTANDWDIPQTVVVTGVDDAIQDGSIAFQIVTGVAVSSDANYNGLNPSDVSVTNDDNDTGAVAPKVESVVFGDGTAQRSMVTTIAVQFDSQVTIDANAFSLERRVGGVFQAIPTTSLSINATPAIVAGKTVATLSFTGTEVTGGSLADGFYRLTIASNKVRANNLDLDGDSNGVAGGDFVRGAADTDNFFRLFGDFDGNRRVNNLDLGRFRLANGTSQGSPNFNSIFDFDANSNINNIDLGRFRLRNGTTLNF